MLGLYVHALMHTHGTLVHSSFFALPLFVSLSLTLLPGVLSEQFLCKCLCDPPRSLSGNVPREEEKQLLL